MCIAAIQLRDFYLRWSGPLRDRFCRPSASEQVPLRPPFLKPSLNARFFYVYCCDSTTGLLPALVRPASRPVLSAFGLGTSPPSTTIFKAELKRSVFLCVLLRFNYGTFTCADDLSLCQIQSCRAFALRTTFNLYAQTEKMDRSGF